MYNPVKDGIDKNAKLVSYIESPPPESMGEFIHCFWELKTLAPLSEDFIYHVLPDACVNLLFNQIDTNIAAVTALQVEHRKLNLGREFHYVGIQLFPGVWSGDPNEIKNDLVDTAYDGQLSLVEINKQLKKLNFIEKQKYLTLFCSNLVSQSIIKSNHITAVILRHIKNIKSVEEMAQITNLSPRQLQRKIKSSVGVTPHDFLKILRIHQSFEDHYLDYYSDQAHFIHSFRKIIGYTPNKYNKKFNV